MWSHAAPPHVPTDGRTASGDPLNGPRYQLPTAQSWIGSRPRWTRGEIRHFRASGLSPAALLSPQRAGSTSHLGNVGSIGFGQRLARPIEIKKGGGPKRFPWTFDDARKRLGPRWKEA